MTILDEIAAYTRKRVEVAKEKNSLSELKDKAFSIKKGDFPFEKALRKPDISFILECKKASPSKGIIAENFEPLLIAKDYEKIGADAVSVLTEPKYFLGRDEYLKEIAGEIKIPVLRKDFGLSALVEVHDENEAKTAVSSGAKIIGVNNRNLKDFSVDTRNSANLREKIPAEILFVSESGVKNSDDIKNLINIGADAVLIGETMMKAEDKQATFSMLKQGLS